ncbi:MAG: F0F1 ATP synthase subunit delta [Lachnospiraceae bacterium]|nr:F0F1 ATP synthase subunit delta [Lachnospiraceae bacterium]
MAKSAITTYGEALFQIALEEASCERMMNEVRDLKAVLDANEELAQLMSNPRFSKEEHLEILSNVFKGRIDDKLFYFLELLVNKGRYDKVSEIFDYFIARVKEHNGIGQAYVTSATEIDAETRSRIKEKLLATTKYKEIEIEYSIDKSLIGGMVIRIKDRIVDNSVKTKLESISRELRKIQV